MSANWCLIRHVLVETLRPNGSVAIISRAWKKEPKAEMLETDISAGDNVNKVILILGTLALALMFCIPTMSSAQNNGHRPSLVVDDDRVECHNAGYTTIQSAVDAARPGDVIRVCPGIYREQVVITKPLHIEGDNGAIVLPNGISQNTISVATGDGLAAAILVRNTKGVTLEGLIIDGSNNNVMACSPDVSGILYQTSSGITRHNAIRHIRLTSRLS